MIRAELVYTRTVTRWPCHVCDGATEKNSVLCEVPASQPTSGGLRVCELCLKEGIDDRLRQQADRLEAKAKAVRDLIGRIAAPSFDDWQHAEDLANALCGTGKCFDEAITWPREQQDRLIREANERRATEVAAQARRLRRPEDLPPV